MYIEFTSRSPRVIVPPQLWQQARGKDEEEHLLLCVTPESLDVVREHEVLLWENAQYLLVHVVRARALPWHPEVLVSFNAIMYAVAVSCDGLNDVYSTEIVTLWDVGHIMLLTTIAPVAARFVQFPSLFGVYSATAAGFCIFTANTPRQSTS